MSPKVKTTAILVLGMLIGGVLAVLIMGYQTRRIMATYAEAALAEMADDVRQISGGNTNAVLQRKNDAIPDMVLTFEKFHAGYVPPDERVFALWAVQRYYDSNPSLSLPSEVKAILDALPPRPPTSCELKQIHATQPGQHETDPAGAQGATINAATPSQ